MITNSSIEDLTNQISMRDLVTTQDKTSGLETIK